MSEPPSRSSSIQWKKKARPLPPPAVGLELPERASMEVEGLSSLSSSFTDGLGRSGSSLMRVCQQTATTASGRGSALASVVSALDSSRARIGSFFAWDRPVLDDGSVCCEGGCCWKPCGTRADAQRRKRMEEDGLRAAGRALYGGPHPQVLNDGTSVSAKFWGVSRAQVQDIYERARMDAQWEYDDSTYTFVEKFVKPWTDGTGRGLALNMNQGSPLEANLMVSHAWVENIGLFFEAVVDSMYDHEVAYIDFLSHYQGCPQKLRAQLGTELSESPFAEVIKSQRSSRLLVVPCEELKGPGLRSRLWCDFEMKVAADQGKPIYLTVHSTAVRHLLGEDEVSSKDARCGDPAGPRSHGDERLLREAIEKMPPMTGRVNALGVCIMGICASVMPLVITRFLLRSVFGWALGLVVGVALGSFLIMVVIILHRICRRQQESYQVVDRVIVDVAKGCYSYRALDTQQDALRFAVLGGSLAALNFFVRWKKISLGCAQKGIIEGLNAGVCLYPILWLNACGTWTGVYIVGPRTRRVACAALCLSIFLGGFVDFMFLRHLEDPVRSPKESVGRGASVGWVCGLMCLSAAFRQGRHFVLMAVTLCASVLTLCWKEGMWHEVMIACLGFGALSSRHDVRSWGCMLTAVMQALCLALLVWLCTTDPGGMLLSLHEEACEFAGGRL